MPISVTDWTAVVPTGHSGEQATATWRTENFGDTRARMVEYSPRYIADHWCPGPCDSLPRGFARYRTPDGKRLRLDKCQSYHVGDGDPPHRSRTVSGAKLFIVD